MLKRRVLLGFASGFLLLLALWAPLLSFVEASPGVIVVPSPSFRIQDAINAAIPGDTVWVASGTYYENVVVNKSLTLIGEGSRTTIIDGNGSVVVYITADNVKISGFTIRNGMKWKGNVFYLYPGIRLDGSDGTRVTGNVLSHNFEGIFMFNSHNSIVSGNMMVDNQYGMTLHSSNVNVFSENVVTLNWLCGIKLFNSDQNKFVNNTVIDNSNFTTTYGVYLGPLSSGNILYYNNFINNAKQAYENQTNVWDNGAEGNFWSDYNGADLNGDGVGDTNLPHWGVDYCPLVEPWNLVRFYDVTWGGVTYCVRVVSNSTIASFNFSGSLMQFGFNVIGPPGTAGFCNITIPVGLFGGGVFMVLVDGVSVEYVWTWNATHSFLYFSYGQGLHNVCVFDVLGAMRLSWFRAVGDSRFDARVDFNGDGFVEGADLALLGKNWYQVWLL